MGYYIEPANEQINGKAISLIRDHGAIGVTIEVARDILGDTQCQFGIVVVVSNPMFDAAGWAFSIEEFDAFTEPNDPRPKVILRMEKSTILELLSQELPQRLKGLLV